MRHKSRQSFAVQMVKVAVLLTGCESGGGPTEKDASAIETRDGGSVMEPSDAGGGITIDQDAGSPASCDPRTEFTCGDGRCISRARQCDQTVDCTDASDESKCPSRCQVGDFYCSDRSCVRASARCDGVPQCADGSDESSCTPSCSGFRCANGACIAAQDRCDTYLDCADGSDERACPAEGCEELPATLPGWTGTPELTREELTQCQTLCGEEDDCYVESNCPGIESFNECANDELLSCSVKTGGTCRLEYEVAACCASVRCSNDAACVETSCDAELSELRSCLTNDSACISIAANTCFAP